MKKLIFIMILILAVFYAAEAQVTAPYLEDYTIWIVDGNLTTSGDQYSDAVTTTTANVSAVAFQDTIDVNLGDYSSGTGVAYRERSIYNCYFKVYVEIKADSSDSAKVSWKIQAKDLNESTWVDLSAWTDGGSAIGTSYVEKTLIGFADLSSDYFGHLPFEYRILVKCDEADEGMLRVKSGSYVRIVFKEY
jgi:hypothetical protein